MAVVSEKQPPQYVSYLVGKSYFNTRLAVGALNRNQLQVSRNLWGTPLGGLPKRPGIGNFGGGSISVGTITPTLPLAGAATVRFNGVTYIIVQDGSASSILFVFPKYPGNTQWFQIGGRSAGVAAPPLSNNIAQLFDPSLGSVPTGEPTAFIGGSPGHTTPQTWTGVTTTFSVGTVAGANTVITPAGLSVMKGIYVGLVVILSAGTVRQESSTVTVVAATTFTVGNTVNNHNAADTIAGVIANQGTLPKDFAGASNITAQYSETLFSNLFYAGEPTAPTAVYTSDPYFPESFTSNYFQSTIYPGAYQPALIGHNDGVAGGDITGLRRLGTSMMVYKQAAIYRLDLTGLYGDMIWQVSIVSPSVGCTAPNSIVAFDSFHVFQSIDGIYVTDGQGVRRIDMNIPTFFDASGTNGLAPLCANFTTSTAGRYGSVYEIYYDSGAGFPNRGLWFDFEQTDPDGYPMAGEITFNASVGGCSGVAPMRGPADTGTLAFVSHTNNLTGEFGQPGVNNDFGFNFDVVIQGCTDLFADFPLGGSIMATKTVESMSVVMSTGNFTTTLALAAGQYPTRNVTIPASASNTTIQYATVGVGEPTDARFEHMASPVLTETSGNPFTLYGIELEVALHPPELV